MLFNGPVLACAVMLVMVAAEDDILAISSAAGVQNGLPPSDVILQDGLPLSDSVLQKRLSISDDLLQSYFTYINCQNCADRNNYCGLIKLLGKCGNNLFSYICPESCGECEKRCGSKEGSVTGMFCNDMLGNKECRTKREVYCSYADLRLFCRETCEACGESTENQESGTEVAECDPDCKDVYKACPKWAGFCDSDIYYNVKNWCQKSCDLCVPCDK